MTDELAPAGCLHSLECWQRDPCSDGRCLQPRPPGPGEAGLRPSPARALVLVLVEVAVVLTASRRGRPRHGDGTGLAVSAELLQTELQALELHTRAQAQQLEGSELGCPDPPPCAAQRQPTPQLQAFRPCDTPKFRCNYRGK